MTGAWFRPAMRSIPACVALILLLVARWCAAADVPSLDFDRQIAPLLAKRCLGCHDASALKGNLDLSSSKAALRGGDSGPAYVPGKLDGSHLWERVSADEMPPKTPLSVEEKELLRRWLTSGAKWGGDPIDVFRFTTDNRAGYDWWSLQPVTQPALPAVYGDDTERVRNPIDRFVLAKLREKGLTLSAEASRAVMIRRLSFDLLGLPPSPEEVAAFESDTAPDAYERLVDRLLASPHYGERWARHWLDVVRYGESQGFERDKIRTNSWRYRDWVVQALNRDMPYGEFVRLQLAGDVLRPNESEGLVATGFLVAGPYDEVGKTQQSAVMKRVVRQDELEDLVGSVSQTFLGLTVNCARCHDHKFDPVRQSEYYRLTAALGGVNHGERPISGAGVQSEAAALAAGFSAQLDVLRGKIAELEGAARATILAERQAKPSTPVEPPKPLARWDFDGDLTDASGKLPAAVKESARIEGGRLVLDGKGFAATAPANVDLRVKTLEAWVQLGDLTQQGGGVLSVETLDGFTFDAIVFGEREPGRWMAGSNAFLRTESFHGPAETEASRQLVHVAIVWHADGTIAGYRNGQPYGKPYKSRGMIKFPANEWRVVFGLRHSPAGGNKLLKGSIDRAQLHDRALSPEEIAASAGVSSDFVSPDAITERLTPEQRVRRDRWQFEVEHLERLRNRASAMTVYAVAPATPEPAHVLRRGNPAEPGDAVTAGGVAALKGAAADFGLPGDAPDAERRKKLAEWITNARSPLFARVMANRMWHYHFGAGLVETCNDFGFNGGRPSHPELLDWLAAELQGSGQNDPSPPAPPGGIPPERAWSLKALHRLIVMSATYRQDSREIPAAMKVDAGNRLLWRRTPQRLEAEAVRDAMLHISGDLSLKFGGPGYEDFTTFVRNSQFYDVVDAIGTSFERRSLYRTWIRSGRSPFLDVFDCPDPSTMTPQRAVTTTPLQALSLLNNTFALRMSEQLARRLERDAGSDVRKQSDRGTRLVYGRPASDIELTELEAFVGKHGLAALCRAWFNSSEFLYVD